MTPTMYGQAQSEKVAEENQLCREMIREINNFGVSQRQLMMLIHLLSSELENIEHARAITRLVRDLGGSELFLIGTPEHDHEVGDEPNGTPNV